MTLNSILNTYNLQSVNYERNPYKNGNGIHVYIDIPPNSLKFADQYF